MPTPLEQLRESATALAAAVAALPVTMAPATGTETPAPVAPPISTPATPLVGGKSELPAEATSSPEGKMMTPDEISQIVAAQIKAATEGLSSAFTEQLTSVTNDLKANFRTGTAHGFETPASTGGAPASAMTSGTYLKGTSDLTHATNHTYIVALGKKALGLTSHDHVASIVQALNKKALADGNFAAMPNVDGTLADGGALVPLGFDKQLVRYLWPLVAVRKSGITVTKMNVAEILIPKAVTVPSYNAVAEGGLIPVSQPTFGQLLLRPEQKSAMVAVQRQLILDSDPAVESILMEQLAQELAVFEDYEFLVGSGTRPVCKGLFSYTALDGANILYADGATGSAGAGISYDSLIDMITVAQGRNVPLTKGVWFMNPALLGAIRKLRDGNDRPLFSNYIEIQQGSLQTNDLYTARVPELLGMPVLLSQQIPTTLTQGSSSGICTSLLLADMQFGRIGERGVVEMTSSTEAPYSTDGGTTMQSAFQQNQVLFRVIERIDQVVTRPEALVQLKGILS